MHEATISVLGPVRTLITVLLTVVLANHGQAAGTDSGKSSLHPSRAIDVEVAGISHCSDKDDTRLSLDPDLPLVLIVHGCFPSNGRFRALADVFKFHGQQALCFNYNDRSSLEKSADQLSTSISELARRLEGPGIIVIGHSQGGLVARRALTQNRVLDDPASGDQFRLVTVSSPFNGIDASAHCGSRKLAWLSLGLTKPICWMVTGSKYREIPPNSDFIRQPGELIDTVSSHLNILTDERGSCRRFDQNDECIEDDFVFSIEEQTQPAIQSDAGYRSLQIKAGHVEIVGDGHNVPDMLIGVLQDQGVMRRTSENSKKDLAFLLRELYLSR